MVDRDALAVEDGVPELLLGRPERTLRIVLRAIVEANDDEAGRTDEARIASAVALLLGRKPRKGAPGRNRDDLLEMLAFDYWVENYYYNRDISVTSLAKRLVEFHPSTALLEETDAIVVDLVRKFKKFAPELLGQDACSSNEPPFYRPIVRILNSFEDAGVSVEKRVVPPGYRNED